ncbi:MAG: protein kinase, partial [Holophagales bacterium]|nr:protein kinase [Holophagales bacterium]
AAYHADQLLPKPFSDDALHRVIGRVLAADAGSATARQPEQAPQPSPGAPHRQAEQTPKTPPAPRIPQTPQTTPPKAGLTSEEIFGEVLAEVEAEVELRDSARSAGRRKSAASRASTARDIDRKLEETLSGFFPEKLQKSGQAKRRAAGSVDPSGKPAETPAAEAPAAEAPAAKTPARRRRKGAPSADEIDDLLDKTLSSLELPAKALRRRGAGATRAQLPDQPLSDQPLSDQRAPVPPAPAPPPPAAAPAGPSALTPPAPVPGASAAATPAPPRPIDRPPSPFEAPAFEPPAFEPPAFEPPAPGTSASEGSPYVEQPTSDAPPAFGAPPSEPTSSEAASTLPGGEGPAAPRTPPSEGSEAGPAEAASGDTADGWSIAAFDDRPTRPVHEAAASEPPSPEAPEDLDDDLPISFDTTESPRDVGSVTDSGFFSGGFADFSALEHPTSFAPDSDAGTGEAAESPSAGSADSAAGMEGFDPSSYPSSFLPRDSPPATGASAFATAKLPAVGSPGTVEGAAEGTGSFLPPAPGTAEADLDGVAFAESDFGGRGPVSEGTGPADPLADFSIPFPSEPPATRDSADLDSADLDSDSDPAEASGELRRTLDGVLQIRDQDGGGTVSGDDGVPFGDYRLLERVAVGGMAEVWRARRRGVEGFQKTVAIKRILSHLTGSNDFVTMFVDEAKLAAQLSHANIIQIYDLGKVDDDFFIAMEFVEGRDLRSILTRAEDRAVRIPQGLSLAIVAALARALGYAHRKRDFDNRALGLVHRDVSPQNVLISYEGEIKLCDFGIVKAVAKASTT